MRLLFIRHADPDYEHDSLTKQGEKEAIALASFLRNEKIDAIYASPLGRAQKTMEAYLKEIDFSLSPVTEDWLREFDANVIHDGRHNAWDFLPTTLEKAGDDAYSIDRFVSAVKEYKESDFEEKYLHVCASLDKILAESGYVREKHHYKVTKNNERTLAFFCHFGVTAMMVSHLINASPLSIAQHCCAAPSSITTLYTEERREGIAQWRMASFGDTSHLALKGMKPSFSGRFSETFFDPRRHD